MSRFAICLVVMIAGPAFPAEPVRITILSTTDLHGNIDPIDYATDSADERGLAKVATLIQRVRAETPNVLLIDSGDALAGTALTYYHATRSAAEPHPMIAAMNGLAYDAMVVGNHEYDPGWAILERARRLAKFPWLAANVYARGTDRSFFQPYVVKTIAGVRIGILGLTTTAIPNWSDPSVYRKRIELRDPLEEAKRWVRKLREDEHVDVVVVAMHMGLEENPETGARIPGQTEGENRALAIAGSVPGIDVMLLGHTHREVSSLTVGGVLMVQAAAWGRSLARVDLTLDSGRIIAKTARTIPVAGVPPDPRVIDQVRPMHEAVERWLNQPVGESATDRKAGEERFRDSALLDFVHQVQMEAGKAQISLAESVNPTAHIPAGVVTVRHLFGLYGVEKKMVTLEVTGRQLKALLEQSARYFRQAIPSQPPETWIDPTFPAYNYYVAEGVDYSLDASRRPGSRILNLRFHGRPVGDAQRLRIATSNYLANGTAEYSMLNGARILRRSQLDLRELLVDWLRRHRHLPDSPDQNWHLLPSY